MHKSDLVELKYLSEARATINVLGLTAIVDKSISSNTLHSVTGILFFDQGYFGQILEGARSAVEETWGRIQKDPRHHNIELLAITEIEERRFPKWSMKLFDTQEFSDTFPQFAELLAKIDNPNLKTLKVLRSLWREV
ncbi:BLUF domain-containing protein [Polynucleobacter arcticus]|uniref:Blue light sensor protein n=1 Tax=Polynucleobacter arcticus TaxID=1743165 RepID=A0A6M9PJS4_9BURK|nr:BLUF domain-containing protein [Polynucleobacter arcticus]QKM60192.1 blue light sensor protein [Polynucleobacter arcticus]